MLSKTCTMDNLNTVLSWQDYWGYYSERILQIILFFFYLLLLGFSIKQTLQSSLAPTSCMSSSITSKCLPHMVFPVFVLANLHKSSYSPLFCCPDIVFHFEVNYTITCAYLESYILSHYQRDNESVFICFC